MSVDAVESGWVAGAATLSLREHRLVRVDEVRQRGPRSRRSAASPTAAGLCRANRLNGVPE